MERGPIYWVITRPYSNELSHSHPWRNRLKPLHFHLDKRIYIPQLMWGVKQLSKYKLVLGAKLFVKEHREILATPCRWELNLVLQALLEVFSSPLCSSLHSSKSCPQGLAVALDTKSTGLFLMLLCGWCWPCSPATQPQVELGPTILYDLLVLWGKTHCVCAHLHTWRAWHLRTVGSCGSKASCIWWASIKGSFLGQNPSSK